MSGTAGHISRRGILGGLTVAPAALAPATLMVATPKQAQAAEIDAKIARTQTALRTAKGTKLVLLGTGAGPVPEATRHMASYVMLSNGNAYILDCGLGATRQYARTGIPWQALKAVFITHMHPDHAIEYGPLLVLGWVRGMKQTVRAYGPPPLTQMTDDYLRSAKSIIDFWAEDWPARHAYARRAT